MATGDPAPSSPLEIDVFVDVVCPWCLVGNERLERALAEVSVPVNVVHHPFLLNPDTPPEGTDIPAMLTRKYGPDFRRIWTRLEAEARASGVELDLTKQRFSYPTQRAHTLIRHAAAKGTQRALVRDLLKANFLDARNVHDIDVLADVAAPHGFTREEVARLAHDPTELAETRAEADQATMSGIHGVPFFVFSGTLGGSRAPRDELRAAEPHSAHARSRFALSGAQPEAVFRSALQQAIA